MRVLTYGRSLEIINALVLQAGLTLVDNNSEVIITHGGDGTLLRAERLYPGVPKLPIRFESICKNCVSMAASEAVSLLVQEKLAAKPIMKLAATVEGKEVIALNEISLYHKIPNQAIRFTVQINDERFVNKAIGDGVVISTPFGSQAYYRSITNSTFRVGIGIAYNNTTESINHLVVGEDDKVRLTLERGPAYLLVDNDHELVEIEAGQTVVIEQSKNPALIYKMQEK